MRQMLVKKKRQMLVECREVLGRRKTSSPHGTKDKPKWFVGRKVLTHPNMKLISIIYGKSLSKKIRLGPKTLEEGQVEAGSTRENSA